MKAKAVVTLLAWASLVQSTGAAPLTSKYDPSVLSYMCRVSGGSIGLRVANATGVLAVSFRMGRSSSVTATGIAPLRNEGLSWMDTAC